MRSTRPEKMQAKAQEQGLETAPTWKLAQTEDKCKGQAIETRQGMAKGEGQEREKEGLREMGQEPGQRQRWWRGQGQRVAPTIMSRIENKKIQEAPVLHRRLELRGLCMW